MKFLKGSIDFFAQHPGIIISAVTSVITWFVNNGFTRIISALPAPTKTSTERYIFWFQWLNSFCGNTERANNTRIESSPNFEDAVKKHLEEQAQTPSKAPTNGL